jgi:DNA topoisomerase-3
MKEIAALTQDIVERIRAGAEKGEVPGDYITLKAKCPSCGGTVKENYRRYACTKCDFSISKHPGSRFFEPAEVEALLRDKQIGPLNGFRSKIGRPFSAVLKITPEHKLEFDFGNAPDGDDAAPVSFEGLTPLGACPKCRARVFEQPMSYVCEKSVGPERSCDFRSGKVILQQPIESAQMRKLLEEGRTDPLHGFISNRTRRKFSAQLVKKPDGTIGFEFAPRGDKKGVAGKGDAKDEAVSAVKPAKAAKAVKAVKAAKGVKATKTTGKATKTVKPASKTAAKRAKS